MFSAPFGSFFRFVALRKESVDRNSIYAVMPPILERRSPQGEHGMFLFLTVQGGHADIRFNFKNCYSKKLSHKII